MARLGTVGNNGTTYFTHIDINECRAFLRDNGLECERGGWSSGTKRGAVYFDGKLTRNGRPFGDSTWTAAFWECN